MKGSHIGLLAVALGVVATLVVMTRPGDLSLPDRLGSPNGTTRPEPGPDAAASAAVSEREAAPESVRVLIAVADAATGRPIPGVSCARLAAHRLHVDPKSTQLLAVSDDAGRLQFVDGDDEISFVLTHPEYVATFVDREPGVRTYTAKMQRGVKLTFAASTREGTLLEGVAIAVAPAGEGSRSDLEDQIAMLGPGVGRNARAVAVTGRDGRAVLGPVSPGALSWAVWHAGCAAVSFEPLEWAMHPELVPDGEVRVLLDPVVGVHFAVSEPVLNWMAKTPKGLHVPGASVGDLELRRRRIMNVDPTGRTVCVLYPVRHDATHGYANLPDKGQISILTEAFGWTDVVADIRPLSTMVEPQFVDLGARPKIRPTTRVQIIWQDDSQLPAITNERVLLKPVTDDPLEQHRQVVLRPGEHEVVPCGSYSLEAANPFLANLLRDRRVSIESTTQAVDVPLGGLKYVEIVASDASLDGGATGTLRIRAGETSRTLTIRGDRVRSLVPSGEVHVHVDSGRKSGETTVTVSDHGQTIEVPLSPVRR